MQIRWLKGIVFLLCLGPLAALVWKGVNGRLGANPIEVVTHSTGFWTLSFLAITLAVTPLRRVTRLSWLIRFRRMLGLFAFFYGTLHFLTYIWLDQFFDAQSIVKDVGKRPFITLGFTAFVLMIPLAVTSTRKMIQRLGGKRWQLLHRLIYVSAIAGVVHFLWLVKRDKTEPAIFGGILALLLGYRLIARLWTRLQRVPRARAQVVASED